MNFFDTRYWHLLENGHVQCDLCPRHCQLRTGQRGLCFVRACENNKIVLTTYGRSSGFCIDPIEKKPLNHFLPGTAVLSFGTAGCNLSCQFCQNWDISKSRSWDTLAESASPETIARAAAKLGCRSVAYTYNEPSIFLEYAIDVAQACRANNIQSVAVTAGYLNPEPRLEFYRWMDAANVDLKGFSEEFYRKFCHASLQPVLDTLEYLVKETNVWVEITTLLIPGANDSNHELNQMTQWVANHLGCDVPWHFTAFHPDYNLRNYPPTQLKTLQQARAIAQNNGIKYVYTGNVHDETGGSTECHNCKQKLIGRDWYQITAWNLTKNAQCPQCGTICAGHFEHSPGTWGPRRLPVHLQDFIN